MRRAGFPVGLLLLLSASHAGAQENRPPIIDMHVHAYTLPPDLDFPWVPEGVKAPSSSEELMAKTLAQFKRFNIVKAWASGPTDVVLKWKAAAPDVILGAPEFSAVESFDSVERLRGHLEAKRLDGIGELIAQGAGLTPSDPYFEPYLQLAEELDVPVAFHTGLPIPGVVYRWFPKARASLGSPLGLEDALVRHPKLRAYIMHAGYPFLDDTIAFLHMHPQVLVDLAEINWIIPRAEFHEYLRRLVQAGFGKRLMFGSDQMWWPDAIAIGIEAIEAAPFLTPELKRDIFYNNAARFLRLGTSRSGGRPDNEADEASPDQSFAAYLQCWADQGRERCLLCRPAAGRVPCPARLPMNLRMGGTS